MEAQHLFHRCLKSYENFNIQTFHRMTFSQVGKRILRLTDNHECELKPPLHGLPVHLVGEVGKADITLQIPLLEENTALLHIPLIKEQNGSSITVIPLKTGLRETSEERY